MRKKIILVVITLVTIPILILYCISSQLFEKSSQENLELLNRKNIISMGSLLQNFLNNSIEISMYPLNETNLQTFLSVSRDDNNYYSVYKNAYDILLSIPFNTKGIVGISLISQSGNSLGTSFITSKVKITDDDIKRANDANGYQVWNFENISDHNYLTLCRVIRDYPDTRNKKGYIKVIINTDSIQQLLDVPNDIPGIAYYIIDNQNYILYSNKPEMGYEKLYTYLNMENLYEDHAMTQMITYHREHYFISGIRIKGTPYALYSISPEGNSFGTQPTIFSILSITAVILICACLLLALFFSKYIVNPLRNMSMKMDLVSNEDFSVRIPIKGNDEIAALSSKFNSMAERLQSLYNEVYAEKIHQKQAELSALISQINPHFLHNTLDTIYWMAEMGDTKRVSKMVSSLSNMMRYTVSVNPSNTVTLHAELNYLKSYINIQKIRYMDSINFNIDVSPGLEDCQILKMILQPLVENAIIHGITPLGKGYISVLIYLYENKLIYEVKNNGTDLNIEKIQKALCSSSDEAHGIALRNIEKRIKLKYGDEYGLFFRVENGETIFTVTQPIVNGAHDKNDARR